MFVPEGFRIDKGYSLENTDVVLGKISGHGLTFMLYGDVNTFPESTPLQLPSSEDEINVLSTNLGVDESVRKLIAELVPRGIKGVMIVNHSRGIVVIIQRHPGGVSGAPGVIRTVEFVYKLPPDSMASETTLTILPLLYKEDYELYSQHVLEITKEFQRRILKELQLINNRRFEQLFNSYENIRNQMEAIGFYIERTNKDFYEQLLSGDVEGVVFNEYPLQKLQNMLTKAENVLSHANEIRLT